MSPPPAPAVFDRGSVDVRISHSVRRIDVVVEIEASRDARRARPSQFAVDLEAGVRPSGGASRGPPAHKEGNCSE